MSEHVDVQADFPVKLQFLFQPAPYKVAYGGRGGGKSWSFARALLIQGVQSRLRILCTREVQNSIKQSVHKLLSDQINELGLESFYQVLETCIRGANGTEFTFAGLSNQTADSIKSFEGADKVWCEEAQSISKKSWQILIPTVRKPGAEIWVSFNPALDTDDTYVRFVLNPPPGTVSAFVNYKDNPWFSIESEQKRLHHEITDPGSYKNVWEGECAAAVDGAIYASEIAKMLTDNRICRVPYDPILKVHTVWDLGLDTTSIILVQSSRSEIRIIDYVEDQQLKLDHYVAELQKKNLNWGFDWLPHDGHSENVKSASAYRILKAFGRKVKPKIGTTYPIPNVSIEIGIRAARALFPRLVIDKDRGAPLVEHWKRYRRSVSATTGSVGAPLHDDHSHGCDATRYLALIADQLKNEDDDTSHYYDKQREYIPSVTGMGM